MPERDQTRINERIGVREVRLVDEDGKQIGVIATEDALRMAQERDLDLVEVAPNSRPPVARLLDYSKYKYEQEQKAKAARKHQQQINVREIKLRPKIATHDYETKKGHVERFLRGGDKVKVTIMFRGREQAHPDRGRMLLDVAVVFVAPVVLLAFLYWMDLRHLQLGGGPLTSAGDIAAKRGGEEKAPAKRKAAGGSKARSRARS